MEKMELALILCLRRFIVLSGMILDSRVRSTSLQFPSPSHT